MPLLAVGSQQLGELLEIGQWDTFIHDHPPVAQDHDAVGQVERLVQLVGDHQEGDLGRRVRP